MRILDTLNNQPLTNILILLTPSEMNELKDKLEIINPEFKDHIHVEDAEYAREITVAVYTANNLHFFSKNVRDLIESN